MKAWFLCISFVFLCATTTIAIGQTSHATRSLKDELVGTWVLVSNSDKNSDGSLKWGGHPSGSLILAPDGRYSLMIVRSDIPAFAANAADKGTAEENALVVRGSIANFGTYSVDESKRSFTTNIEGSTYPNLRGKSQTRTISFIDMDEFRYTNPATANGASAEAVWRRASSAAR